MDDSLGTNTTWEQLEQGAAGECGQYYICKRVFKKIENKYFIDNRPVDQVVDEFMVIIKDITVNKTVKNSEWSYNEPFC
jgi:hypothetical protein